MTTTCYNETGTQTNTRTVQHGQSTSGSLSSLLPLTLCCVRVSTVNNCPSQSLLNGPPSEICGSTDDVTPGTVTSLTATGVSREAILITWGPPDNYRRSGLEYVVSITSDGFSTVTNSNFYYRGELEAAQQYTVSIQARSGVRLGDPMQVVGETLPNSPLPPDNPSLTVADSDTLTLSWNAVNGVSDYVAVLRCNEQSPQEKEVSGTTVDFDVSDPAPNFAWCTAQVQSENSVGRGQFSELVSAAIPSSAPSDPRCYLVDDQGSSVTFTFDVTDPFSLHSLSLRYKLIADYEDEAEVRETSEVFEGDNRLTLSVARNTMYSFRLRLCNTHGCSQYCSQLTNFTTSSVSSSIL